MNKEEAREKQLVDLIAAMKTEEYKLGYKHGCENGLKGAAREYRKGYEDAKRDIISQIEKEI